MKKCDESGIVNTHTVFLPLTQSQGQKVRQLLYEETPCRIAQK